MTNSFFLFEMLQSTILKRKVIAHFITDITGEISMQFQNKFHYDFCINYHVFAKN